VHNLRRLGVDIETIHESHRGPFPAATRDMSCAHGSSPRRRAMSRKSRGRKPDATGRSKGEEQFLPIPFSMSRSAAFRCAERFGRSEGVD
jgi:hypothetical protein